MIVLLSFLFTASLTFPGCPSGQTQQGLDHIKSTNQDRQEKHQSNELVETKDHGSSVIKGSREANCGQPGGGKANQGLPEEEAGSDENAEYLQGDG